jgi:membrane protein YqaA with SNARE-associated domain
MGIAAIMGIVMDEGFLHLVGIFLISGVKFLVGLGWAIAFVESDWLGFTVASMGGIFGSFIWIFMGHWIQTRWIQFQRERFEKKSLAAGLDRGEFALKKFSKKNRKLVKLKRWGGVYLLVFLAPLIISIPVGCLILSTMESNRYRILLLMSISVLLWGTGMYLIAAL